MRQRTDPDESPHNLRLPAERSSPWQGGAFFRPVIRGFRPVRSSDPVTPQPQAKP